MSGRRVIDHGSMNETIIDLPDGGRVTIIREKSPQPVPEIRLPINGGRGTGLIGIMEADAESDRAAEDITTEWDREWGIKE
jgi:hypothetical protein